MRHATWNAIEANPWAMKVYRSYRHLPEKVRGPARWLVAPRWQVACAMVRRAADNRVLSGPFQGMAMELSPVSSRSLLGYLLGTQELELHGVIETIIARKYATIVNVGVADGYYAIGLARRMPDTTVVGFEALDEHHELFWRAARENGVAARVRLGGFCMAADLKDALSRSSGRSLVLCDIEGGEKDLLDDSRVPELAATDILVETHDGLVPGCSALLLQHFAGTHDVQSFYARPRTLEDFPSAELPQLAKWMPGTAVELMHERRTGVQEWLFLTAKQRKEA